MKLLGLTLLGLGVLVGVGAAVWLMVGLERVDLPLWLSVSVVKHTIAGSVVLMGAGAFVQRIARRRETKEQAERALDGAS